MKRLIIVLFLFTSSKCHSQFIDSVLKSYRTPRFDVKRFRSEWHGSGFPGNGILVNKATGKVIIEGDTVTAFVFLLKLRDHNRDMEEYGDSLRLARGIY